jgi:hypothetical protein
MFSKQPFFNLHNIQNMKFSFNPSCTVHTWKVKPGQIGSAWEWSHWIGLKKSSTAISFWFWILEKFSKFWAASHENASNPPSYSAHGLHVHKPRSFPLNRAPQKARKSTIVLWITAREQNVQNWNLQNQKPKAADVLYKAYPMIPLSCGSNLAGRYLYINYNLFQGYQTKNWAAKLAENFAISERSSYHIFSMTIFMKVDGNICTCLLFCLANNLLHNIQNIKFSLNPSCTRWNPDDTGKCS